MHKSNDLSEIENGRRESDSRPKRRSDLLNRKKEIFMDEALAKTEFGFYNLVLIFFTGLTTVAAFAELCGISFVIPVSECDLNLTPSDKGILSGIAFLGVIFSSFFWGYLADAKGRRCVIMPTLFAAFVLSVGSSIVQNFYLFVTLRFLNGFLISGPAAVSFVYLGEFHDTKLRTRSILYSNIIFGFGCFVTPIVASLVINQDWHFNIPYIDITYKPWRSFVVKCSLPGFIAFLILIFLPESPKYVLSQGNKWAAYETLRNMYKVNNMGGKQLELFEIMEEPESIVNRTRISMCKESRFPFLTTVWVQTVPLFKPPLLLTTVLICASQFGIYTTESGFYMFVPEILNKMASNVDSFINQRLPMCDAINMKPTNSSIILKSMNLTVSLHEASDRVCVTKLESAMVQQEILLEAVFLIGAVVVSFLVNKLGKFPVLISILIFCGSGGIVCMQTDIPLIQVCSFIALMTSALSTSIISAIMVELYPTSSRATAVCIAQVFSRLGGAAGANFTALLLTNHCETVFYFYGTLTMAIALIIVCIPNIRSKSSTVESVLPSARHSVTSLK